MWTGIVLGECFQNFLAGVHYRWVFLMVVSKNVASFLTWCLSVREVTLQVGEIVASIDAAMLVMDRLCMRLEDPVPGSVGKPLAS